jgi:hypothetical protein
LRTREGAGRQRVGAALVGFRPTGHWLSVACFRGVWPPLVVIKYCPPNGRDVGPGQAAIPEPNKE